MFSQPHRYTHSGTPSLAPPPLNPCHPHPHHLRFVWLGNLMQINFIYQNIHQNVCAATRPL